MIPEWATQDERRSFLDHSFDIRPYAQAGTASSAIPLLGWSTLDAVLGSDPAADVLTVSSGKLLALPAPRSAAGVRRLMARGVSTVIRGAEPRHPGLHCLAASFREILPRTVRIQLYATPSGHQSFGWHYDVEDVFIAQTLGIKDYHMRENTIAPAASEVDPLDFTRIREERTPRMSARLLPGDWLYIPHHWWHLVRCAEDSLSISVGVGRH